MSCLKLGALHLSDLSDNPIEVRSASKSIRHIGASPLDIFIVEIFGFHGLRGCRLPPSILPALPETELEWVALSSSSQVAPQVLDLTKNQSTISIKDLIEMALLHLLDSVQTVLKPICTATRPGRTFTDNFHCVFSVAGNRVPEKRGA